MRAPPLKVSLRSRRYAIACALLLVAAAALRFYDLGGSTLRYDEAVLANMTAGTLPRTLDLVRAYHSAPMGYPTVLWALQKVKTSPVAVRIVPAMASVLAIAVLVLWLPMLGVPRPAAFLAGLIATVSAPLIEHAQDVREYGIDVFVAALMIAGLLAWVRRRRTLLFGAVLFAAPQLQYGLVLFGIAALIAAALLAPRRIRRRRGFDDKWRPGDGLRGGGGGQAARLWPPAAAFGASSLLSYALTVHSQASRWGYSKPFWGHGHWMNYGDPGYDRLLNAERFDVLLILEVMSGKLWNLLQDQLSSLVAALAVAAVLTALALRLAGRRQAAADAAFALCGIALAVAIGAAVLNVWPLDGIRQSLWLAPAICLAVGCAMHAVAAALPWRGGFAVAVLAVSAAGARDIAQRDPWRSNTS